MSVQVQLLVDTVIHSGRFCDVETYKYTDILFNVLDCNFV